MFAFIWVVVVQGKCFHFLFWDANLHNVFDIAKQKTWKSNRSWYIGNEKGMTNDVEIEIYGFIDKEGNALVKVRAIIVNKRAI